MQATFTHVPSQIPNTPSQIPEDLNNDIEHLCRLRSSVDLGGSEDSSEAAPRQKKSQPSVKQSFITTLSLYFNLGKTIL